MQVLTVLVQGKIPILLDKILRSQVDPQIPRYRGKSRGVETVVV